MIQLQVTPSSSGDVHGGETLFVRFSTREEVTNDPTQRGVTMSPRIQVYKAIACRALSDGSQGANSNLLTLAGCGDADVQARAARIQACTSGHIAFFTPYIPIT